MIKKITNQIFIEPSADPDAIDLFGSNSKHLTESEWLVTSKIQKLLCQIFILLSLEPDIKFPFGRFLIDNIEQSWALLIIDLFLMDVFFDDVLDIL